VFGIIEQVAWDFIIGRLKDEDGDGSYERDLFRLDHSSLGLKEVITSYAFDIYSYWLLQTHYDFELLIRFDPVTGANVATRHTAGTDGLYRRRFASYGTLLVIWGLFKDNTLTSFHFYYGFFPWLETGNSVKSQPRS